MADRPAPLVLVVDPGAATDPDLPFGSYAAVGLAGRRRLAIELSRRLDVSYNTAWAMHHKLRQVMLERNQEKPLDGRVECEGWSRCVRIRRATRAGTFDAVDQEVTLAARAGRRS